MVEKRLRDEVSRMLQTISVPGCHFDDHQRPGSFITVFHVYPTRQRMQQEKQDLASLEEMPCQRYQLLHSLSSSILEGGQRHEDSKHTTSLR